MSTQVAADQLLQVCRHLHVVSQSVSHSVSYLVINESFDFICLVLKYLDLKRLSHVAN
jgi:hypothetical protein